MCVFVVGGEGESRGNGFWKGKPRGIVGLLHCWLLVLVYCIVGLLHCCCSVALLHGLLLVYSDWILISDLSPNYVFPCQIALTELRPDVVIYSNTLKHVILLELTCPCEENMECWHSTKLSKYSALVHIIRSKNWSVDIFAIEVGARGYPSHSLHSSLRKLGLPNKTTKESVKRLGKVSMESSFYIWMHRNSKEWTCESSTISSANKKEVPKSCNKSRDQTRNPKSASPNSVKQNGQLSTHSGFINKGNTCYINAILQVMSVLPSFWCQQPSQTGRISPVVTALTLNMSLLKKQSSPVDPSNFLRAFQNSISRKRGTPFNFNTQQDVPEILQLLIDELKGESTIADDIISVSANSATTWNSV